MTGSIYLYGNHSAYHSGSKSVWDTLVNYINQLELKIVDSIESADIVLVNGEGSMHHNTFHCRHKMKIINNAQDAGKSIYLVNTLWQSNKFEIPLELRKKNRVVLRELYSQNDLFNNYNLLGSVAPDLVTFSSESKMIYRNLDSKKNKNSKLTIGSTDFYLKNLENWVRFSTGKYSDTKYIDMKNFNWLEILNEVSNLDILITGRHHAIYACLITKTPFVPISSNSHKIEGLLASANINISCIKDIKELDKAIEQIISGTFEKDFIRGHEWLSKFKIEDAIPIQN